VVVVILRACYGSLMFALWGSGHYLHVWLFLAVISVFLILIYLLHHPIGWEDEKLA